MLNLENWKKDNNNYLSDPEGTQGKLKKVGREFQEEGSGKKKKASIE